MLTNQLGLKLGLQEKELTALNLVFTKLDEVIRWKQVPSMPEEKRDSVTRHTINAMHMADNCIKDPGLKKFTMLKLLVHDFGEVIDEFAQGQHESQEEKDERHIVEQEIAYHIISMAFDQVDGGRSSVAKTVELARDALYKRGDVDEALQVLRANKVEPNDLAKKWIKLYEQTENMAVRKNDPTSQLAKLIDKMQGHLKYARDGGSQLDTLSKARLKQFQKKIDSAKDTVGKLQGGREALAEIKKSLAAALRHVGLEALLLDS